MKCEFMAKQLPGIRSAVAKELKKGGMTQESIAEVLGVSQGAVSQYLSSQRGSKFESKIEPVVRELCLKILRDRTKLENEICIFCKKIESI